MPENPSHANLNLQEIAVRNEAAARIIAGFSGEMPTMAHIWRFLELALADVPALSAEVARLAADMRETRLDRANLLAVARATLAAYADGEEDPLSYLRDELYARGEPPPRLRGSS